MFSSQIDMIYKNSALQDIFVKSLNLVNCNRCLTVVNEDYLNGCLSVGRCLKFGYFVR